MTIRKKEIYIMAIVFLVTVFGILIFTGTITSGMHLVDDHEHYTIQEEINNAGLIKTIKNDIESDLTVRFRPLYRFLRVVGTSLFGTNAVAWSIYKGLEIVIAMLFLYIFTRKKGLPIFFSLLFSLFCFVGEQSEIWWRLGPQEGTGMVIFGAGLVVTLFLCERYNIKNRVLFVVLMVLLSLQKETFLLTIPIFYLILFDYECNACENNFKKAIQNFFQKYIWEIIAVFIACLIDVYMIIFVVGTDKLSYAGFTNSMKIMDYVENIVHNCKGACLFYLVLMISMIGIVAILFLLKIITIKLDISYVIDILICVWILGIEQVCYARSGMYARYLLPWVFGIFYFIFIIGYRILKENEKMCRIVAVIMSLVFLFPLQKAIITGTAFGNAGKSLWQCIDYIKTNTDNQACVVSMFYDTEPDNAFRIYLDKVGEYKDVHIIKECEDDEKLIKKADVLFGYNSILEQQIVDDVGNKVTDYDIFATTNYKVAIKKK